LLDLLSIYIICMCSSIVSGRAAGAKTFQYASNPGRMGENPIKSLEHLIKIIDSAVWCERGGGNSTTITYYPHTPHFLYHILSDKRRSTQLWNVKKENKYICKVKYPHPVVLELDDVNLKLIKTSEF
jgi:hypothetical protein